MVVRARPARILVLVCTHVPVWKLLPIMYFWCSAVCMVYMALLSFCYPPSSPSATLVVSLPLDVSSSIVSPTCEPDLIARAPQIVLMSVPPHRVQPRQLGRQLRGLAPSVRLPTSPLPWDRMWTLAAGPKRLTRARDPFDVADCL